jgi:protein-disulfide isomerase
MDERVGFFSQSSPLYNRAMICGRMYPVSLALALPWSTSQSQVTMLYMRVFLTALLCLCAASAQVKPPSAFDKPTLEAYLRHLLAVPAEVQFKIEDAKPSPLPGMREVLIHMSLGNRSEDRTFYVSNDGRKVVQGFVYDVAENPFKPQLDKLKTDLSPSFGAPGAPVVVVVFSDFQCPYCKEEAKSLRDNIPSTFPKEVRVYFKDFPLEQIHPWAKAAAMAGRCVFRENAGAFWQYHDWMYEHQADFTVDNLKDKIMDWAKGAQLDSMQLGRCIDTKASEAEVDKEVAEGKSLQIQGTPTMFINGRPLFNNYPWQNIEQIIRGELNYQQAAKNAGEKCCEISIPSPLSR